MKSFSPMTREEKLAGRRARDRAAYARDPEKFRKLSHENRLKPAQPSGTGLRDVQATAIAPPAIMALLPPDARCFDRRPPCCSRSPQYRDDSRRTG